MARTFDEIDASGMLDAIATLPDQLHDGLARTADARAAIARSWPEETHAGSPRPRALVVCGMGGSGVGADLLPAAFEPHAPIIAVKGYDIPAWVTDEDRVVCVSYSGNTAETISCFRQAVERSVVAAVITSGGELGALATDADIPVVSVPAGYQPRAAVGVLFGALAGIADALNVVSGADETIRHAAAGARTVIDMNAGARSNGSSDEEAPALAFARQLDGSVVVVYGAGITVPVANRWKAQINENSKLPAFAHEYPELDHNELVGWERAPQLGARWSLVELVPAGVDDEIMRRMDITRDLIEGDLSAAIRLDATSADRAGSVFELLVWGDYISVFLALLGDVDPTPVERIRQLKSRLEQAGRAV